MLSHMSLSRTNDTMTSYLHAIQKIPGDTTRKKFEWIGRSTPEQRKASGDLDQFSPEVLAILQVETAVKRRIHEDITWALKSNERAIVRRALRANWFFDGSHKDIIDTKYFREQIFPFVSLNTRNRMLKTLVCKLIGKDTVFAQEMFATVESFYGFPQALPLLVACDEDFAYRTIAEKKVILSRYIAKLIFRRNPNLIVRYLRMCKSDSFHDNAWAFNYFLPRLVKKQLENFVELYETHEERLLFFKLSNTRAEFFLKNGLEYLMKKPNLYIRILPLKKIRVSIIESIFSSLMPEKVSLYDTDSMLYYLEYYPEDDKLSLLCKTYNEKYSAELLDTMKNVTVALMLLLPAEERIKQAKIKIDREQLEKMDCAESTQSRYSFNRYGQEHLYKTDWTCYLSIEDSIPTFKKEISKVREEDDRINLISKMIYACKINKDDDALYDCLLYFKDRHKNESSWIYEQITNCITQLYDVFRLSEKLWSVLSDINRMFYVKYGYGSRELLIGMIHFKLVRNMPITDPIEMLLDSMNKRFSICFDEILKLDLQYARPCLVACIDGIQQKFYSACWAQQRKEFLYEIVTTMYSFNEKCKKSRTTIKRMMLKDYPWLMTAIRQAVWNLSERWQRHDDMRDLLHKNEPELYLDLYCQQKNIADIITSGEALRLLKKNPQVILDNWEAYLVACKKLYYHKQVQNFIRATRWYKDIPIKFMERCRDDVLQNQESSSLIILAILDHGKSLTKLIDLLMPKETTIDVNNPDARNKYQCVHDILTAIKSSEPPVSLDFVARLCEGDYLSIALTALTNVSRRTPLPQVMLFAQELANKRVSVRKHAVRIMYNVAPLCKLTDFFLSMWNTEKHHSIREVLLLKALDLVYRQIDPLCWHVLSTFISTLTLNDKLCLSDLVDPRYFKYVQQHIVQYIQLVFNAIDSLAAKGLEPKKTNNYTIELLKQITGSICLLLPDEFTEKLLRKYLFNINMTISEAAIRFTIHSYLFPANEGKYATRIKVFDDIFVGEVKSHWNVPHPKKCRFYPINYIVHKFIEELIAAFLTTKSTNTRIISDMLRIFLSVLTPHMDPESYLLLIYTKERKNHMSPEEYGLQIGRKMHELVEIFSSLFLSCMSKTLCFFLTNNVFVDLDTNEAKLRVIEGLVEAASIESYFMAVNMLSLEDSKDHLARYDRLIEKFRKIEHPGIKSILSARQNEMDHQIIPID